MVINDSYFYHFWVLCQPLGLRIWCIKWHILEIKHLHTRNTFANFVYMYIEELSFAKKTFRVASTNLKQLYLIFLAHQLRINLNQNINSINIELDLIGYNTKFGIIWCIIINIFFMLDCWFFGFSTSPNQIYSNNMFRKKSFFFFI